MTRTTTLTRPVTEPALGPLSSSHAFLAAVVHVASNPHSSRHNPAPTANHVRTATLSRDGTTLCNFPNSK